MAIHLCFLPPKNIEATLFNREWTCADPVLLSALQTMTGQLEFWPHYEPDPDWRLAQWAIERFGGEILNEDELSSEEDEPDEQGRYPIY
ncbi:MAG: hypothetical protein K1X65_23195 [Caldilineales bacterium]|nr:hypothetical protein [Caldilineales bacterium]